MASNIWSAIRSDSQGNTTVLWDPRGIWNGWWVVSANPPRIRVSANPPSVTRANWAGIDLQTRFFSPAERIAQERVRLDNLEKSIVNRDTDPVRSELLFKPDWKLTDQDRQFFPLNPSLNQDRQSIAEINSFRDRLDQQEAILNRDYEALFWESLNNLARWESQIRNQTRDLLEWQAIADTRNRWFAVGQARSRWASQAQLDKVNSDLDQQWRQQRLQIVSQEADRLLQQASSLASWQQNVASAIQQQNQQDFANNITARQLSLQERANILSRWNNSSVSDDSRAILQQFIENQENPQSINEFSDSALNGWWSVVNNTTNPNQLTVDNNALFDS